MPKFPKSPPDKKFDGLTCTRYASDFIRNKVIFIVLGGEDLWIQICMSHAPKRTAVDFYIDSFKSYTACEVIRDFNGFLAMPKAKTDCDEWGRHFEDGIHEIWKALDLPFGYVTPMLKRREGSSHDR